MRLLSRAVGMAAAALLCYTALAALVIPRLMSHSGSGINPVQSDIASLESALKLFRLDCGRYPATREGLNALRQCSAGLERGWKGPYMDKALPLDPWKHPYHYKAQKHDGYVVESYGSDGKPGGVGDAADIVGGSD